MRGPGDHQRLRRQKEFITDLYVSFCLDGQMDFPEASDEVVHVNDTECQSRNQRQAPMFRQNISVDYQTSALHRLLHNSKD